jgi:cell division protein FtsB
MKGQKRRYTYLILLVFMILLIAYYTIFGDRGILKMRKLGNNLENIRASTQKLQEENEGLKREIRLLQEDEEYIERIAREELGLAREDEIIYKSNSE